MKFPHNFQLGARDCGPACLKMIAEYYGQNYAIDFLRDRCHITKVGVSLLGISEAAESIGFHSIGTRLDLEQLKEIVNQIPVILHWQENHFVVIYKAPKPGKKGKYYISDPDKGQISYSESEFVGYWMSEKKKDVNTDSNELPQVENNIGYALLLEPTPKFFNEPETSGLKKKADLTYLLNYFTPHKKVFLKLLLGLLISNGLVLINPFLTQLLVDKGINLRDMDFIYMILIGQLLLFAGSSITDLIRGNLLLHMGTKINIAMVSDFLSKMLRLPISFFETHITGDLLQRIQDHGRVENLLTVSSLNTIFSMINFIALSVVLAFYNPIIFAVFIAGSLLSFGWTLLFLAKRKKVDFKFFEVNSKENNKVIEILSGMPDIKISNSMRQKRWEWENIQSQLYQLKIKSLSINQFQFTGSSMLKQCTSILITFLAAKNVMSGEISLGTMFAITMIVGQLSSPLEQLHEFITSFQDARMSMDRINDVMLQEDEDPEGAETATALPEISDINLAELSFGYGSDKIEPVLDQISMCIPAGKVTAIVGASGSGKTTLMKLLLRFYDPWRGNITLGDTPFTSLNHAAWREKCGVVMQNGMIFNGTIADNISLGQEKDSEAILKAARIANIDEFIESLSKGYMTEVGNEGVPLSTGQTQRILLARAVYKNPTYLFLDEATSALDAGNEKKVIENLNYFFKGRTVVVVAHRLSTVKNADQIIVMEKGRIAEIGTHAKLTEKRGIYYMLVKNQLELGD